MAEHSKLMSPSASGLWLNCSAQPQAKADLNIENSSNPAADLGTLKHGYSEEIMLGKWDEEIQPNDIDQKEWKDVPKAIAMLKQRMKMNSSASKHWYELKTGFNEEWRADCFGTVDVVTLDITNKTLHITDYKFGHGAVSAKLNTQLMIYACLVLQFLKAKKFDVEKHVDKIYLEIIQPKLNKEVDSFMIHRAGLEKWDKNTLQPVQRKIAEGKGEFKVGPWCGTKYCELQKRNLCPLALQETIDMTEDFLNKKEDMPASNMSAEELRVMEMSKTLEAIVKATFAKAKKLAEAGEKVPGYKLVRGKGSRKWKDEEAANTFLTNQKLKADERSPKKFITAPQAETVLQEKGAFENKRTKTRFDELVIWTPGKPVLATEDDTREEIIRDNVNEDTDELFDLLEDNTTTSVVETKGEVIGEDFIDLDLLDETTEEGASADEDELDSLFDAL